MQPDQIGVEQAQGWRTMGRRGWSRLVATLALALSVGALISAIAAPVHARDKTVKVGVVYVQASAEWVPDAARIA
jgi:ABC-type sugar transport system substrate-binding protein